jgi:hypothetical protein
MPSSAEVPFTVKLPIALCMAQVPSPFRLYRSSDLRRLKRAFRIMMTAAARVAEREPVAAFGQWGQVAVLIASWQTTSASVYSRLRTQQPGQAWVMRYYKGELTDATDPWPERDAYATPYEIEDIVELVRPSFEESECSIQELAESIIEMAAPIWSFRTKWLLPALALNISTNLCDAGCLPPKLEEILEESSVCLLPG